MLPVVLRLLIVVVSDTRMVDLGVGYIIYNFILVLWSVTGALFLGC